jgi:hypothetical protein
LTSGLKPKLPDLVMSMGENETEFKTHNFAQTIARYHAIDIHIRFCVGNSSSITIWLETRSGVAKLPIFSRNPQKSVSLYKWFSWAPPLNQNENDTLHSHITVCKFSFWFKSGAKENYWHKDTGFCWKGVILPYHFQFQVIKLRSSCFLRKTWYGYQCYDV